MSRTSDPHDPLIIDKPHQDTSLAEYEDQIRVNSSAAFTLIRTCAQAMNEKGSGRVVNFISETPIGECEGHVPYVTSKGAMYGPTLSLALTNIGPDALPFGCESTPGPRPAPPPGRGLAHPPSGSRTKTTCPPKNTLGRRHLTEYSPPQAHCRTDGSTPASGAGQGPARIEPGDGAVQCSVTASESLGTALAPGPGETKAARMRID